MMQDGFSILSPAGYIMDVSLIAPVNGTGTYGRTYVSKILPRTAVQTRGKGELALSGEISGRQGTIAIDCITGAAGATRALCFIAVDPTILLGVILDVFNRPFAILMDVLGNIVGISNPLGTPIGTGMPLSILFAWDSTHVVYAGHCAAFQYNNDVADWVSLVTPWVFFVPRSLYLGTALGGFGLLDFNGTIGKVQISNSVYFDIEPGAEKAEDFVDESFMYGTSIVGADATVAYAAESDIVGASTVSADSFLVLGGDSDIVGASVVGADATVEYAIDSTMAGATVVAPDATVVYAAESDMAGASVVGADATVVYAAESDIVGASAVSASPHFEVTATMAGATVVAPDATVEYAIDSTMAGATVVAPDATVEYAAESDMAGVSVVGADATVEYAAEADMPADSEVHANATRH